MLHSKSRTAVTGSPTCFRNQVSWSGCLQPRGNFVGAAVFWRYSSIKEAHEQTGFSPSLPLVPFPNDRYYKATPERRLPSENGATPTLTVSSMVIRKRSPGETHTTPLLKKRSSFSLFSPCEGIFSAKRPLKSVSYFSYWKRRNGC